MLKFENSNTLSSLLYKSYSKNDITHMDMFNKRSYSIIDDEKFLRNYTKAYLYLTKLTNFDRYLLERSTDNGPIIVDIDLSKKQKMSKPLYTKAKVLKLARLFQKTLKGLLAMPSCLECFVLEKPGYFKDGVYKNGFHLHFPHVWLSRQERQHINFLVQQETKIILDNSIIRGNWFLYGSKKSPESNPYLVSYIIEEKRKHVPCSYSDHELIFLLSIRQKEYTVINKLTCKIPLPDKKQTERLPIDFDTHTQKSDDELNHYVEQLSEEVSDNYTSWRSVGCAVFNESHGEEYGEEIWHAFSQMSIKYNEDECNDFWQKMKENSYSYSLGTIIHYIKKYNNDEFIKF